MTETEHDEMVAPALAAVMRVVAERGGSILAYSSFYDDGTGEKSFTFTGHALDKSAHEMVIEAAIRTKGNIDSLLMAIIKLHVAGAVDASNSFFLSRYLEPT